MELTDEPWRTAELVPVVAPSARVRRARTGGAVVVVVAAVLILMVSLGRDDTRCGQSCYGAPPNDRSGSLSYEPGHAWTRYAGSWQWSAQSGLAFATLLCALIGVGLTVGSRRRAAVVAFALAAAAGAAWVVWVLLTPAA
jgi:ferric-dicitrate binding protein FerR (iron transport regulator)